MLEAVEVEPEGEGGRSGLLEAIVKTTKSAKMSAEPESKKRRIVEESTTISPSLSALPLPLPLPAASCTPAAPVESYLTRGLEPSIFRLRPHDDVVRIVSDFILFNTSKPPPQDAEYEIEAKIGKIVDKQTGYRINLPVMNECVIMNDSGWCRFESNMSMQQHQSYNKVLNKLVDQSRKPVFRGSKVQYEHKYELDEFYRIESGRLRVTKDAKTKVIIPGKSVIKDRVADLNVYIPTANLDYRISVSLETTVPLPAQALPVIKRRHKDRLSYTHELFTIDLTQVKMLDNQGATTELFHELEVEVVDMDFFNKEKQKLLNKDDESRWVEAISSLLNNVRGLARKG